MKKDCANSIFPFRRLKASEISVCARQDKETGPSSILLYQANTTPLAILDECVPGRWENKINVHFEAGHSATETNDDANGEPHTTTYYDGHYVAECELSVRLTPNSDWTTRTGVGCASLRDYDPPKAAATDAMKRALVLYGPGRELYTTPRIHLPKEKTLGGLTVAHIAYNGGAISELMLVNSMTGEVVYTYHTEASPVCDDCGDELTQVGDLNPATLAQATRERYGRCLCGRCTVAAQKKLIYHGEPYVVLTQRTEAQLKALSAFESMIA